MKKKIIYFLPLLLIPLLTSSYLRAGRKTNPHPQKDAQNTQPSLVEKYNKLKEAYQSQDLSAFRDALVTIHSHSVDEANLCLNLPEKETGLSFFHTVILSGNSAFVGECIEHGAHLFMCVLPYNQRYGGLDALEIAITEKNDEMVALLLTKLTQLHVEALSKYLAKALEVSHKSSIKMLISKFVEYGTLAPFRTCLQRHLERIVNNPLIKRWLQHALFVCAPQTFPNEAYPVFEDGNTPLHTMAEIGCEAGIMRLMIEQRAMLDVYNTAGDKPIHVLVKAFSPCNASQTYDKIRYVACLRRFLMNDQQAHEATRDHRFTPLFIACLMRNPIATCVILEHGLNPHEAVHFHGETRTPFSVAATNGLLKDNDHLYESMFNNSTDEQKLTICMPWELQADLQENLDATYLCKQKDLQRAELCLCEALKRTHITKHEAVVADALYSTLSYKQAMMQCSNDILDERESVSQALATEYNALLATHTHHRDCLAFITRQHNEHMQHEASHREQTLQLQKAHKQQADTEHQLLALQNTLQHVKQERAAALIDLHTAQRNLRRGITAYEKQRKHFRTQNTLHQKRMRQLRKQYHQTRQSLQASCKKNTQLTQQNLSLKEAFSKYTETLQEQIAHCTEQLTSKLQTQDERLTEALNALNDLKNAEPLISSHSEELDTEPAQTIITTPATDPIEPDHRDEEEEENTINECACIDCIREVMYQSITTTLLEQATRFHIPPLCLAIIFNMNARYITILIEQYHADPFQIFHGYNALHWATFYGNYEAAEALILDPRDNHLRHYVASPHPSTQSAFQLINSHTRTQGEVPLYFALKHAHYNLVKLLLHYGARESCFEWTLEEIANDMATWDDEFFETRQTIASLVHTYCDS